MRKVKSTALLGAFVAVASVGVISHEAHGTTIGTPNNQPTIISKEMLPNPSATLQASIIPSVGFNSSNSSITLTISGASFVNDDSYTISSASCSTTAQGSLASLTFSGCNVSQNDSYAIITGTSGSTFSVSVPASSSSIVLAYSSNAIGDTSTSATIAQVQQQLYFAPISAGTAYINPSSLSTFNAGNGSGSIASNSVVLSNSAYSNSTWSNTFNSSITMSFVFTGIPSSVSTVSLYSLTTPVNGSATVSATISASTGQLTLPFSSSSSDTLTFYFSNSNNVNIQTGTISLSSIVGSYTLNNTSSTSYAYLPTPQNFLSFSLGATEIYVPDALASISGNAIQYSYITISMPSSASIASINVLNVPSASCPAPSTSNGLLQSTSTTGVYYIDLGQLAKACTGISPVAWQSGVPLVIYISGSNATPNNITADAYAVFLGHLKRIPANVISLGNSTANFSY